MLAVPHLSQVYKPMFFNPWRKLLRLEQLEDRRLLATVTWDGGGDGINWHDPSNWDNDTLPSEIDDVVIDVPGQHAEIRIESAQVTSVRSLDVDDRLFVRTPLELTDSSRVREIEVAGVQENMLRGNADIVIDDLVRFRGGAVTGSGTLYAGMNATIEILAPTTINKNVELFGMADIRRGLSGTGDFHIHESGIVNLFTRPSTSSLASGFIGAQEIVNGGTISQFGNDSGATGFGTNTTLINHGSIDIQGNRLEVRGGGSTSTNIEVPEHGLLRFTQSFAFASGTSLFGAGSVELAGSGAVYDFSDSQFLVTGTASLGGETTINNTLPQELVVTQIRNGNITFNADQLLHSTPIFFATVGGSGALTLSGSILLGARISNSGGVLITDGTTINVGTSANSSFETNVENRGTINVGSSTLGVDAILTNAPGARINLSDSASFNHQSISGNGQIVNDGIIQKTGAGLSRILPAISQGLDSQLILEGHLTLLEQLDTMSSIDVPQDALLEVAGGILLGVDARVTGAGSIVTAGQSDFSAGELLLAGTATFTGKTKVANSLNPSLQLELIRGDFESSQDQVFLDTDVNAVLSGDAHITFAGNGVWNRSTFQLAGVSVAANAMVSLSGFANIHAPLTVHGTVNAGNASVRVDEPVLIEAEGQLHLTNGRLRSESSDPVLIENYGTIQRRGSDVLTTGIQFLNHGTLVNETQRWTIDLHPNHLVTQDGVAALVGGTWIVGQDSQPPPGTLPTTDPALLHFNNAPQVSNLSADVRLFRNDSGIVVDSSSRLLSQLTQIMPSGSLTLGHRILRGIESPEFVNHGLLRLEENSRLAILNGSFRQTSLASLQVEIAGLASEGLFGVLNVQGGNASLAGTLAIELVNNFGPPVEETYPIISHNSVTGDFNQVTGLLLNRVSLFQLASTANNTTLTALVDTTDLAGSVLTFASEAVAGDLVTVEYTVDNQGEIAAEGSWVDAIYLSRDNVLDAKDSLFARVEQSRVVETSYTQAVRAQLPALLKDEYRFILVTDSRGQIPDKSRANNRIVSPGTINVATEALQFGVPKSDIIRNRESFVYRLDVPHGVDVEVSIAADQPEQIDFITSTFGDRDNFRVASLNFNEANIAKTFMIGRPGTWYLGVRGRPENADSEAGFTITATQASFGFSKLAPNSGSNKGKITSQIEGTGFTLDTSVALVDPDGIERAGKTTFVDTNLLYVEFDLFALEIGDYSIRVANESQQDFQPNAFTVNDLAAGKLEIELRAPEFVRAGGLTNPSPRTHDLTVIYRNVGHTDITAPLLELKTESQVGSGRTHRVAGTGRGGGGPSIIPTPYRPLPSSRPSRDMVLGISSQGPAGVLAPGESGSVTFSKSVPNSSVTHAHQVLTVDGSEEQHDWLGSKEDLRPASIQVGAWDVIYDEFVRRFAPTYSDYEKSLGDAATYLSSIGSATGDVPTLLALLFAQVNNQHPGTLLATAEDTIAPTVGLPLSFMRLYPQSISNRHRIGPLGYGWAHPFELSLSSEQVNNATYVTVVSPYGARLFRENPDYQPQTSVFGPEFFSGEGDGGALRRVGNSYQLREPDGRSFLFDSEGRLEVVRDLVSRIELEYESDRLARLVHVEEPFLSGSESALELTYNPAGRISTLTDYAGRITSFHYDVNAEFLVRVVSPNGSVEYEYESHSVALRNRALTSVRSDSGIGIQYDYDPQGRLRAAGPLETGPSISLEYGTGGEVAFENSAGNLVKLYFNEDGNVARRVDPLQQATQRYFDNVGYPDRDILPGNLTIDYSYSGDGFLRELINANGDKLSFSHRNIQPGFAGTPSSVKRLATLHDENGNRTTYGYNRRGQLTTTTHTDSSQDQSSYDRDMNLVQTSNRNGDSFTFEFDALGRVTARTHPDGSREELTYDRFGNLIQIVDRSGITTLTYDAAEQLTRIEYPDGRSLDYEYDAFERLVSLSDQDGFQSNYRYDVLGRLERILDGNKELVVQLTYDSVGNIVREDRGNGTFTTYAFDAVGQLVELINHASNGIANSSFFYTLDALGRRIAMQTLNGSWTYHYDSVGQLVHAEFVSNNAEVENETLEYRYDEAGNRISSTRNGEETLYIQNNLNQYVQVGDQQYEYDAAGNLTRILEGTSLVAEYEYDSLERLIAIRKGENEYRYEYNFFGNRIASIVNGKRTEYLIDPTGLGDVIGEYTDQGELIANYNHGLGLINRVDNSGAVTFYDFDGVGSTVGISSDGGNYLNRYGYLPFGETQFMEETLAGNPFQFVGQFGLTRDGSGLDFVRARFYSSQDGRFVSDDPAGTSGGVNLYRYASNSPNNYVDPSGYFPIYAPSFLREGYSLGSQIREHGGVGFSIELQPKLSFQRPSDIRSGYMPSSVGSLLCMTGLCETGLDFRITGEFDLSRTYDGYSSHVANSLSETLAFLLMPAGDIFDPETVPSNCEAIGCDLPNVVAESDTTYVISKDPNDILGPRGIGPLGHMRPTSLPLGYTIRFENLETAEAHAAEVRITQTLDSDLDFSTFEFTGFGFGDFAFEVVEGDRVETRMDLRDEFGVFLDVLGDFNRQTGELVWVFTSLDPETFDIPLNPFAGFLPPNQDSQGEGFISYQIRHTSDLPTGTAIDAEARIFFDFNEPIDTPPIVNTIDRGAPSSSVNELPAFTAETRFTVSWSGQDDLGGSGITTYDVYVSQNGGAFQPLLLDTNKTALEFTGEVGSTYAFYSVARDRVGFIETVPTTADTFTAVSTSNLWQNPVNAFDVNDDGFASPIDALLVINELNQKGSRKLSATDDPFPPYIDPSGDNFVSPIDALLVVNWLNFPRGNGEVIETDSDGAHDNPELLLNAVDQSFALWNLADETKRRRRFLLGSG